VEFRKRRVRQSMITWWYNSISFHPRYQLVTRLTQRKLVGIGWLMTKLFTYYTPAVSRHFRMSRLRSVMTECYVWWDKLPIQAVCKSNGRPNFILHVLCHTGLHFRPLSMRCDVERTAPSRGWSNTNHANTENSTAPNPWSIDFKILLLQEGSSTIIPLGRTSCLPTTRDGAAWRSINFTYDPQV
jgi:hypothetical protein